MSRRRIAAGATTPRLSLGHINPWENAPGERPSHIPEIREAVALLESWEKAVGDSREARRFTEAMELLNAYLESEPDTPYRRFITNLKVAHTRRLLQQLASVDRRDFGLWLEYALAVVALVDKEAGALQKAQPELARDVDAFLGVWREALTSAAVAVKGSHR